MNRLLGLAVVFASILASPNAAAAEPVIHMMVAASPCTPAFQCRPPRIVEIDVGRGEIVAEYEIPIAGPTLSVTADGGYLFWVEFQGQLRIFNVAAKQSLAWRSWPFGNPVSHPSVVRAFAASFDKDVALIDGDGARILTIPGCGLGTFGGISGDGARLFFRCASPQRNVVVDASTGGLVGTTPVFLGSAALNEDGSELVGLDPGASATSNVSIIRRFDVATGAELQSNSYTHPFGSGSGGRVFLERHSGRWFAARSTEILAFDSFTLSLLARIALPATSGSIDGKLIFDPNRPAAYALTSDSTSSRFHVIDTDRFAVVASVLLPYDSHVWDIVMAPYPPAPVNLVATTIGRRVTLTWDAAPRSPALTHFVIEAGLTPGATDVVLRTATAETSLVVDAVPSDTYYVRVRAVNVSGQSGPSIEVAVTVE